MMQTDCLLQDFILKETKGGALQREREIECEALLRFQLWRTRKNDRVCCHYRFETEPFRVNVSVKMSVKKKRE